MPKTTSIRTAIFIEFWLVLCNQSITRVTNNKNTTTTTMTAATTTTTTTTHV